MTACFDRPWVVAAFAQLRDLSAFVEAVVANMGFRLMIWFTTSLISDMILRIECHAVLLSLIDVCLTVSWRACAWRQIGTLSTGSNRAAWAQSGPFSVLGLEVWDWIPGGFRLLLFEKRTALLFKGLLQWNLRRCMFRAKSCSSPGGQILLIQHLVSSLSVSGRPVQRTATYRQSPYQILY